MSRKETPTKLEAFFVLRTRASPSACAAASASSADMCRSQPPAAHARQRRQEHARVSMPPDQLRGGERSKQRRRRKRKSAFDPRLNTISPTSIKRTITFHLAVLPISYLKATYSHLRSISTGHACQRNDVGRHYLRGARPPLWRRNNLGPCACNRSAGWQRRHSAITARRSTRPSALDLSTALT